MRRKLGLLEIDEAEEDQELITDLLQVMHDTGADFTNTFRRLSTFPLDASQSQGQPMLSPTQNHFDVAFGLMASEVWFE